MKESQGFKAARYKARVFTKTYSHREGIDFSEVFIHVVKHTSTHVISQRNLLLKIRRALPVKQIIIWLEAISKMVVTDSILS